MQSTVEAYKALTKICNKAKDLAESNSKYINDFGLPIIGKTKDKRYKKDIQEYFDSLHQSILENFYIELIASFEANVIEKIKLSSEEMRVNIKNNYPNHLPFQSYENKFVKNEGDLSSLNKILYLLEEKIDSDRHEQLKTVVKFRDKLAHGKRFHKDILLDSIEDTHILLEKILDEI
jgi:hypothetical protein